MNALELLELQHGEVQGLFAQLEAASGERKAHRFGELADLLRLYSTVEENHFYPLVKTADTEDVVLDALEEHLAIRRLLGDLTKRFDDAKLVVLDELFSAHVKGEREQLFPKIRALFDAGQLEAMGQIMASSLRRVEAPRARKSLSTFDRLLLPFAMVWKLLRGNPRHA